MSQFLCHDFKTPRTDMSRRLPASMRMVPVIFYLVLLTSAVFMVKDMTDLRKAERDLTVSTARKDEAVAAKTKLKEEAAAILTEKYRAEGIAKWVEGTRVIQPISVAVARAMPPETNITELSLERNIDVPAQVSMLLRLVNGGAAEIENVQKALDRLHYRSHSPQQAKQGDVVEFRSMLVWQTPSAP